MQRFNETLRFRTPTLECAAVAMLICIGSLVRAQDSLPSWTNTTGKTIQAEFIRLDGHDLIIRKDGKVIAIPLATLSAESQNQARSFADKGTTNAKTPKRRHVEPIGYFIRESLACRSLAGSLRSSRPRKAADHYIGVVFTILSPSEKPGIKTRDFQIILPDGHAFNADFLWSESSGPYEMTIASGTSEISAVAAVPKKSAQPPFTSPIKIKFRTDPPVEVPNKEASPPKN